MELYEPNEDQNKQRCGIPETGQSYVGKTTFLWYDYLVKKCIISLKWQMWR